MQNSPFTVSDNEFRELEIQEDKVLTDICIPLLRTSFQDLAEIKRGKLEQPSS